MVCSGGMAELFEVLTDCGWCRVEAAVVELIDPDGPVGVAAAARCRLCGWEECGGVPVSAGRRFVAPEDARAALLAWASEDGDPDVTRFVAGGFCGLSVEEVAARLCAGEPVETTFDVVAWLFGGSAGGGVRDTAPTPARSGQVAEAPSRPRLKVARAFASVLVADGVVRPSERAVADRLLAQRGEAPIEAGDLRVWRPLELGLPDDPEPLLRDLVTLAWADGVRDETEWRVVREYARAWGVRTAVLDRFDREAWRRYAPATARLLRGLQTLFITEPQ